MLDIKSIIRDIETTEGGDPQSAVTEIILDLRHICERNDLDFAQAISNSAEIFAEDHLSTEDQYLKEQYTLAS